MLSLLIIRRESKFSETRQSRGFCFGIFEYRSISKGSISSPRREILPWSAKNSFSQPSSEMQTANSPFRIGQINWKNQQSTCQTSSSCEPSADGAAMSEVLEALLERSQYVLGAGRKCIRLWAGFDRSTLPRLEQAF